MIHNTCMTHDNHGQLFQDILKMTNGKTILQKTLYLGNSYKILSWFVSTSSYYE